MSPIIPPKHICLSRLSIFQGLSPQELTRLEPLVSSLTVKANSVLLETDEVGDFVYFIVSGTICIHREQRDLSRIILNMVGAGDMLGEACAVDNGGHTAAALATEPTALLRMRRTDFCALNDTLPQVSKNLHHLLVRRLRFATLHSETLSAREVHVRVSRLLCALADRYRQDREQRCVAIPLRLTQSEIAEWICVSRQHASTHLHQLRECGVIETDKGHHLVVLDCQRLREYCG